MNFTDTKTTQATDSQPSLQDSRPAQTMDGCQAAEAIRALDRPDAAGIPIIAMSADAFADDVQHCLDSGMNAHTPKPMDVGEVARLLAEHFQQRDTDA